MRVKDLTMPDTTQIAFTLETDAGIILGCTLTWGAPGWFVGGGLVIPNDERRGERTALVVRAVREAMKDIVDGLVPYIPESSK